MACLPTVGFGRSPTRRLMLAKYNIKSIGDEQLKCAIIEDSALLCGAV